MTADLRRTKTNRKTFQKTKQKRRRSTNLMNKWRKLNRRKFFDVTPVHLDHLKMKIYQRMRFDRTFLQMYIDENHQLIKFDDKTREKQQNILCVSSSPIDENKTTTKLTFIFRVLRRKIQTNDVKRMKKL